MVQPPGVVTGRYGTIGELFYVPEPFWPLNTTLYVRDFHGNDPRFVYYHLQRFDFATFSGKSGVPGVNRNDLHTETIFLPIDISEQRAIADALSDVDGLLAALDRLIAKKRDLKQAAMQQLLTGQLRLPGFHGEWEVKRLGDLAEMGSGGTPSSSNPDYYDGDIPWVSISDMTKGGKVITSTDRSLTRKGLANSAAQMFLKYTVLYAMYASLGECSIAGVSLCSSQAILGIRPKDNKLGAEFLYYLLTSMTLGQQGTQANLNKGMVQDFLLPLPALPEQTAIAEVLTDMDAELAALEQRRDKTRLLKQAVMQELLTGRTRLVPPGGAE
jgi:type I restriction enzyme S subunit